MNILRRACPLFSMALLLSCGGGGGGGSGGGNEEPQHPPTVTLDATPGTVPIGGTTTLTWTSSSDATSCDGFGGWTGTLPLSGSATSPDIYMSTEFGVRCGNAAGNSERTTLINVRTPELTLTVTPEVVQPGQAVNIVWRATDMQYCQGNWGFRPTWPMEGDEQVVIEADTETFRRLFYIECGSGGVTMRRTAVVQVKMLRGQVLVPRGVAVDGDVNDPESPLVANDSVDEAEGLPYQFTRIGYVNLPLSGPEGRSYLGGDISDFSVTDSFDVGDVGLRLTLSGVDLTQPVGTRVDADLYVYDSLGNLLDASVGSGREESVIVPGGDNYYVEVRAVTGAVTYMLELEPSPEVLGTHGNRLSAPFVSDEAIVIVEPTGRGAYKAQAGTDVALSRLGLSRKAGGPGRELRVSLPVERAAIRAESPRGTRMTREQRRRLSTLLSVKALAAKPGVRAASKNSIKRAETLPNDPLYASQRWHYELIHMPQAWDITTGSPDVTVAVVDTGIVPNHPDLQARLRDGYDMVSDPANADQNGLDPDPDDPGGNGEDGTIYHGTHVAGTIGAMTGNGVGVAGINWSAAIMPVRVLDGDSGTTYDILQGVRYAAGMPNDSGVLPSRRADIINLSLGSDGECDAVETEVFSEVRDAGVIVVASAGNDRSNMPHAPSSCPGVFSVGAVGGDAERAWYSNFGQYVDLAAPGGDPQYDADGDGVPDAVVSTHATGPYATRTPDYGSLFGTSMAAPHVSGVFSLMKSVAPSLTPADFEHLLAAGALTDDPLQHTRDEVGHGVLDALKAVRAATGDFDGSPRLVMRPSVLRFDGNETLLGLNLSNSGGGLLTVTAIIPSASWLSTVPAAADANGMGTHSVVVDRTGLPFGGERRGSLQVVTTAGTLTVPVLVTDSFGWSVARGDYPMIYISIVDADTGVQVHFTRLPTNPSGIRFDDLPPGRYYVTAGTDLNHDGDVCDLGELCGEHPFYGLHQALDHGDTSEDIDVPLVLTAKQDQGL